MPDSTPRCRRSLPREARRRHRAADRSVRAPSGTPASTKRRTATVAACSPRRVTTTSSECGSSAADRGSQVDSERHLHGDLGESAVVADRRVADGLRDELLVRDHEPVRVGGANPRVDQPDLLDDAADAVELDLVAEPDRLGEGDQQAGDEVPDRALGRKPEHEADHGRGREDPGCDPAHLRDHEQRGERRR